jgi:predicted nucleic acid-binding protein
MLPNRPEAVRAFVSHAPEWLIERAPLALESLPSLHSCERAAISLAKEINADLLLIDELHGRKEARARGIPITGTIGLLELAAARGMLDLGTAFEAVKKSDFWISPDLLDERLALFRKRNINQKRAPK